MMCSFLLCFFINYINPVGNRNQMNTSFVCISLTPFHLLVFHHPWVWEALLLLLLQLYLSLVK